MEKLLPGLDQKPSRTLQVPRVVHDTEQEREGFMWGSDLVQGEWLHTWHINNGQKAMPGEDFAQGSLIFK